MHVCQSCGVQLDNPAKLGTEKDKSRSGDYCIRCYKLGEFREQLTLEEIATRVKEFLEKEALLPEDEIEARLNMLPTLKRWMDGR